MVSLTILHTKKKLFFFFAVERLREQWDEAGTKSTQRRRLLDEMLRDSGQLEELRAEIERFRCEWSAECDRSPEATASVDRIEKQLQAHKVSTIHYCLLYNSHAQSQTVIGSGFRKRSVPPREPLLLSERN